MKVLVNRTPPSAVSKNLESIYRIVYSNIEIRELLNMGYAKKIRKNIYVQTEYCEAYE